MSIESFLEQFNREKYVVVLKRNLPTRYLSDHTFHYKKKQKGNRIYLFLCGFFIISLYFFKQLYKSYLFGCKSLSEDYKLLVYLPNRKYQRFYEALFTREEKDNILLLTDELVDFDSVTKNHMITGRVDFFLKVLWTSFARCVRILYINIFNLRDEILEYSSILHLSSAVFQSFFLISLREQINILRIFSLHPNGDFHFIAKKVFNEEFHSIRPDTTTYSLEHKYIETDYLYYKSEEEREVYESYSIKTKLVKGGYLFNEIYKPKRNFKNVLKVLFIDTCTNTMSGSDIIRQNAVSNFYEIFGDNNRGIAVSHKFHPGLNDIEKEQTSVVLKTYGINPILADVKIRDYDIVIGFYSTMFHDVLCSGVSFVELSGEYNMYPLAQNSLYISPILKINSKKDFIQLLKLMSANLSLLYPSELWNWYYGKYNIPEGKNSLKLNLLKNLKQC